MLHLTDRLEDPKVGAISTSHSDPSGRWVAPATGDYRIVVRNVIGDTRVSTEDQAREGVSIDAQEHRLRAFAQAKGWQLVAVVRDEGKSAKANAFMQT